MIWALLNLIVFGGVFFGSVYFWIRFQATRSPKNHISRFKNTQPGGKVRVVFLGDSLTMGTVSANFVDLVQKKNNDIEVINAGENGDLAYNAAERSDKVIALEPDYVCVLIGSNDVRASLTEAEIRRFSERQALPESPTLSRFKENLKSIVEKFKKKTKCKIVLISVPLISENLQSKVNQRVAEYNTTIKAIARENGVAYIPFFERMIEQMKFQRDSGSTTPTDYQPGSSLRNKMLIQRFVFPEILELHF